MTSDVLGHFWPTYQKLLAGNNIARRSKFHRYVRQFLPRDHGGFGHKNQKMSWRFRHCTKSQTFSNSCAQNRHDLLAKIGKHIYGTSGPEIGSSADPTLVPTLLWYKSISKIRWSLTYLPATYIKLWRHMWMLPKCNTIFKWSKCFSEPNLFNPNCLYLIFPSWNCL